MKVEIKMEANAVVKAEAEVKRAAAPVKKEPATMHEPGAGRRRRVLPHRIAQKPLPVGEAIATAHDNSKRKRDGGRPERRPTPKWRAPKVADAR